LNIHSLVKEEQGITAEQLRSTLSRVSLDRYPELQSYTRDEIYGRGDQMSPGALFLAARMARGLEVRPGDIVLDVGCGLGESSIFLAKHYGVRVVAVDLGILAVTLSEKFSERSCEARVTALNLDITEPLPFADGYFDAVFCMTSIHYFGVTTDFLKHLLKYLKRGGRFCVGNTCFDREIPADQVPDVYRTTPPGGILDGWQSECSRYHSPAWWQRLFADSGIANVVECLELEDGPAMWEDKLAYDLERSGWSQEKVDSLRWKIDQILYGRNHRPRFTFFVATVERL
jgi:SAM-dependent methyltransferase